jgi:hypothetical protein
MPTPRPRLAPHQPEYTTSSTCSQSSASGARSRSATSAYIGASGQAGSPWRSAVTIGSALNRRRKFAGFLPVGAGLAVRRCTPNAAARPLKRRRRDTGAAAVSARVTGLSSGGVVRARACGSLGSLHTGRNRGPKINCKQLVAIKQCVTPL